MKQAVLLMGLVASSAFAADCPPCKVTKEISPWKGTNIAVGGSSSQGNVDSQTLNSAFNLSYLRHKWLWTSNDNFNFARTEGKGVTTSKLFLSSELRYNFGKRNYSFINGNYTDDRFDGYRYVANASAGYGRRFIDYKGFTLDAQAGPGYQRTVKVMTEGQQDKVKNLISANGGLDIAWVFSSNAKFTEDLTYVYSQENARLISITAITTNIYDKLALQASFQAQKDSKPLGGKKSYNSLTQLSLIYTFA